MVTHEKVNGKKVFKNGKKPSRATAYRRAGKNAQKSKEMTEDEHEDIKKKTFKNIYKDNEDIFEEVMKDFVTNRKTPLTQDEVSDLDDSSTSG